MTDHDDGLVDIEIPVKLLFRARPDMHRLDLARFVENVLEHGTVRDVFHAAIDGADLEPLAYDGYSVPALNGARFAVGDVEAALADGDPEDFHCAFDSSPGAAIEEIVTELDDAIVCPDGYRLVVTSASDADMVLVRVHGPSFASYATFAQDWDRIAPRSLWDGEVTLDTLRETLEGVVAAANRALEAAGL